MTDQPATEDKAAMAQGSSTGGSRSRAKSSGVRDAVKDKLTQHGAELRDQAGAKAREYAEQGKDKAVDALSGVSRFFGDTANALDDQLGADLGGYVHRAADAVAGFTDALKNKDVDDLLTDARDAVRRNPALAIGAAAAVGFVLVRLIKSASPSEEQASPAPRTPKAPRARATRSKPVES